MRSERKRIRKPRPTKQETLFQTSTKMDILGLLLASFVAIAAFFTMPPDGLFQWGLKSTELAGCGAASFAILGVFHEFRQRKQAEREKKLLEEEAQAEDMPLHKLMPDKIERGLGTIREMAESLKMSFRCFFHSLARATMDFDHSVLDFVDVQEENYRINFVVRILRPESIERILRISPAAKKNLVRVIDEHHLAAVTPFPMTKAGIKTFQSALILWVIVPCYLIDRDILT